MLPHLRKKNRDLEKKEPFVSVEREMADAYREIHPEADSQFYTPTPAREVANTELEASEKKTDGDKEDSE